MYRSWNKSFIGCPNIVVNFSFFHCSQSSFSVSSIIHDTICEKLYFILCPCLYKCSCRMFILCMVVRQFDRSESYIRRMHKRHDRWIDDIQCVLFSRIFCLWSTYYGTIQIGQNSISIDSSYHHCHSRTLRLVIKLITIRI